MSDALRPAAEELLTARLSLRRPEPADVDAILALHSGPRTCAHNPSGALHRYEEAQALFQAGTTSGGGTGTGTGSSGPTTWPNRSASAGSSPWNCTARGS
ncbi:hypothetical protein AB0N31_26690 [Streptomyces sp. NPDC051051]|uniref:hypothetical protein n=1 Tax=Streptomyces sp. NPDC051051 TaxID=3155666 RepID=UPI00341BE3E4